MIKTYGIRHHGPGSAASLLHSLKEQQPDCMLVEAPADAENLLKLIPGITNISQEENNLLAPVAILIYNPKAITQASYLPFAGFSPEWQAIKYANESGIPVRAMDLSMELQFGITESENILNQRALDFSVEPLNDETSFQKDPIAYLAKLAGYNDSERWWEVHFESTDNKDEIFSVILEMMTALRHNFKEKPDTLLREAFMRHMIRKTVKDNFQNIAVICGAWHAPVLHDHSRFKASEDAALLRGLKKIKTVATWIPWSYDRLCQKSGYGAGVISPAWYELLFQNREEATLQWMIHVARLFREKDFPISTAHVINAIHLAEGLAQLNKLPLPGIHEMKEAAISTFCDGQAEKFAFIEQQLIIGDKVGYVPGHLKVPAVPLLRNIEASVKSARLSKYWEKPGKFWLGETTSNPKGGIDIREDSGKLKSQLLHRLNLLQIPWGETYETDKHYSAGDFREYWLLNWSADFVINIIEKGALGNTLEDASTHYIKQESANATLVQITELLGQTLKADLPQALDALLEKLETLAVLSTDVFELMDALPHLASIARYGDTFSTDITAVSTLIQHFVPRICIGLPGALIHLDENASKEAQTLILNVNHALNLLNNNDYNRQWHFVLRAVSESDKIHGLLTGFSTRMLFDKSLLSSRQAARSLSYSLSTGNSPLVAASWLEGFLQGSGLILLHNNQLWNLIDEWVSGLKEGHFKEVLPLLRRTFARFSARERQVMFKLAKQKKSAFAPTFELDFNEQRAKVVLPVVKMMLGIE